MTKLKDVLEGKSSGNYFTPEQIEKVPCIVVEDLTPDSEIREYDTGKEFDDKQTGKKRKQVYYCIRVTDGKEVKDLHLTWVGLTKYFAPLMPATGTWKGQQFVIEAVKTRGKLDIKSLGLAAPGSYQTQTTIPQGKTDVDELTDAAGQLLKALAHAPSGIMDAPFWEHVKQLTGGNLSGGMALVQHLKEQGKIFQDSGGFWRMVK